MLKQAKQLGLKVKFLGGDGICTTELVKLAGEDDLWRIRVGDWRIIYAIEDDKLIVFIVKVGHRREIYR